MRKFCIRLDLNSLVASLDDAQHGAIAPRDGSSNYMLVVREHGGAATTTTIVDPTAIGQHLKTSPENFTYSLHMG